MSMYICTKYILLCHSTIRCRELLPLISLRKQTSIGHLPPMQVSFMSSWPQGSTERFPEIKYSKYHSKISQIMLNVMHAVVRLFPIENASFELIIIELQAFIFRQEEQSYMLMQLQNDTDTMYAK